MNHSERKEYRQQRKKLKRRRKESAKMEKESIKKQKKRYKEERKAKIKRDRKGESLIGYLFTSINPFKKHSKGQSKSSWLNLKARKQRRTALKDERRSLKRKKHNMRKQTSVMRKRIRQQRIDSFIHSVVGFLKHPIKRKKATKQQIILKRQIKIDSRKEAKRMIANYPSNVLRRFNNYWNWRWKKIRSVATSIGGFFKLLRSVFKFKELRRNYLFTAINSTILFILAFLSVYYLNQFITIYTAKIFDIPAVLFSYRIYWPLYTYSSLYSRMALILIFGSGPLINLALGFMFYRLYVFARWKTTFFKTYFIWAAIHSFTLFFGAYIVGVITRTGFVYSSEWLFLSNVFDVEEILFLIISVIVMVIIGYYSTKHFIMASNSSEIIEPKLRLVYMLSKVLIPWFFGNIALFLISYPNNPMELNLLLWVSVLVIIPIFTNYNTTTMRMVKLHRSNVKIRMGWLFLGILIVVMIIIRYFVHQGISFS